MTRRIPKKTPKLDPKRVEARKQLAKVRSAKAAETPKKGN